MPIAHINKRLVSSTKAAAKDQWIRDDEVTGFCLKVTPSGAKSYVLDYRVDGRQGKARIGDVGAFTPEEARTEAKRLRRLIEQGIDPNVEKQQRRRDRVTLDIEKYVERFTEDYLRSTWRGGFEVADGILRRHVVPKWKGRHLKDIRRSDVRQLLEGLEGQALRRNCFSVVRKMFKWAVNNGDIEESPVRDMDPPPAPASRDRVLTNEELSLFWEAASGMSYPFGPFFRLLIITGQRREEVAAMRWEELHRTEALWNIPSERVKNNFANHVPLSAMAISLLDELAGQASRTEGDRKWPRKGFVFTTTGKTAVSGYSKAKARLDREMLRLARARAEQAGHDPDEVDIANWRNHDLRRTLATGMRKLGVTLDVTEAVLNHQSGKRSGLVKVYQIHDYEAEKRQAMDEWAAYVSRVTAPAPKTTAA